MASQPTRASPWQVRDSVFIFVAAFVAAIAGVLIAGLTGFLDFEALADIESPEYDQQLPRLIMVAAVAQFAVMYGGLKWLSIHKGTGNFQEDYHLYVSLKDWPFLLYGAGLLFVAGLAITGLFELLSIDPPTQDVVEAAQRTDDLGEKVVIVLVIAVVAPILEEMLFRGALLDALKHRMSVTRAIWITGITFGIVHLGDPGAFALVPFLIGLGVILGYVRERGTGSLSRPILMHMGFNAVTALALVFSLSPAELEDSTAETNSAGPEVAIAVHTADQLPDAGHRLIRR